MIFKLEMYQRMAIMKSFKLLEVGIKPFLMTFID